MTTEQIAQEVNALLMELSAGIDATPFDPTCEVHARMLAAATGITERQAAYKLKTMENNGELTSRWVHIGDSPRCKVYRKK